MARVLTAHNRFVVAIATTIVLACVALFASACSGGGASAAASSVGGAAFDPPDHVAMPVVSSEGDSIDTSHVSDGYVVVHESSASRLKVQIICGDMTYNYDLPNDGTPTVYPINMGDGDYRFRIMKNVGGNDYVESESVEETVKLSTEFAPFVIPNQFCMYDDASACVVKARELTANAANQGEAVQSICEYLVDHIEYDSAKARELSSMTGYVPNPDDTLATGTGVCFDYASLGAAMLRSVGLPTKIITGYVTPGDLYHAWIMVYIDGSWHTGEFSVDSNSWSRVDLTFAASGSTEFTGDGTSYTDRYVY